MPIPIFGLQGKALDDALFFNALENASANARQHGFYENYSAMIKKENATEAAGGFMQAAEKPYHYSINKRIFAYAFKDHATKCKIVFVDSYFSTSDHFTPDQLQGICLASVGSCEPFSVVNPYSNPDYCGIDLVNNLSSVTVQSVPHVFVPIINLTVYTDLLKEYYQAALHLYAGDSLYDSADTYTRPYLRPIRRFQLTSAAIKSYLDLAVKVSSKFPSHLQKQIQMRLIYQTAFWHLPNLSKELIEFLDALNLSQTNNIETSQSYVHCIKDTYALIQKICNLAVEYMEQMQHTEHWRYEQPLKRNSENDNQPPPSTEAHSIKEKICAAIITIQHNLNVARSNLNKYSNQDYFECNQIVLDPPEDPEPIVQLLLSQLYLINLKMLLVDACSSAKVRKHVLDRINNYVFYDGKNHLSATILTDAQLQKLYQYAAELVQEDGDESIMLLNLVPTNFNIDQSDLIVPRKSTFGQTVRNRLEQPRSILFRRTKSGFELWLIPNSKDYAGNPVLPKFHGSYAKVSIEFNITPLTKVNTVANATRVVGVENEISSEVNLTKDMWPIPRAMCQQYINSSKNRRTLVKRTNDPWTPITLFHLILQPNLYQTHPAIQSMDVNQIKHRLITLLLDQIHRMHVILGAIHRDIKPGNILVDLTNDCAVHLVDFNISVYQNSVSFDSEFPLSTIYYASPQVVGFHLSSGSTSLLYNDIVGKSGDMYTCCVYGRELFDNIVQYTTKEEEFKAMLACTSDDMFSLGITLFLLISSCYPTQSHMPNAKPYCNLRFMHVNEFVTAYPNYKCVLDLLNPNPTERPTIAEFKQNFARIPTPEVAEPHTNPVQKRSRVG